MSVTAGTGGYGTVDATGGYIFQAASAATNVTAMQIWTDSSDTGYLKILATNMHNSGAELCLPAGAYNTTIVRLGRRELSEIHVKASTSTMKVYWGVVAITGAEF